MGLSDAASTPRTVDDIDAAWLSAALSQQRPGATVLSVAIEDIMPGFSTKVRVRPQYASGTDLPDTLIVKGYLAAHQLGNSFSYEVETQSYAEVVPTLTVNTPACYFAGTGAGGPVVILEDLKPKGVRFLDPLQPLTRQQATDYLTAIARIHSRHWDSPDLAEDRIASWLSENSPVRQQMNAYFEDNVGPKTWNEMAALPRGAALPYAIRDQAKVQRAYERFVRFKKTVTKTLVHGDEHPANFYLEADGTPGFLDWQSRKEAWSTCVAYFMILCLDILDRRTWERDLLQHYLTSLTSFGVAAPRFDEAWEAYRASIVFPYNVWFTNRPVWQPEIFCTACATRAGWAMYDHKVFDLPD